MPPRQLWIAVLIALAAWTLAAGEAPVLRPGETVRLEMPKGDPDKTSVTLPLVATEDGPLTVETSTLYFDTVVRVFEASAAADAKPLAEDGDGGVGGTAGNSRLTFEATAGRTYRVEVGSGDESGGPLEVSVVRGAPQELDADERRKRDAAYWDTVVLEGRRSGSSILEARGLLGRGTLQRQARSYADARGSLEAALTIYEKLRGLEHPDTAMALNNLGRLYWTMGEYASARSSYERALGIYEKSFGAQHPETARGLTNLATVLHEMGEYAAARPLHERALAIREKGLGPEHPDTAQSLSSLAWLLQAMGEDAAARPLYERALAVREKVHGPEHPETATALNNLALLLQTMGEYAAARPLYDRALAIYEKVRGPEDPYTAAALDNLAGLLRASGEHALALPLYERALGIRERVHGPEHPYTATTLTNLAYLLEDKGEYAAARPLYERGLAIYEKVLGPEHPTTALSLNNLASVLRSMGDYAAARPLCERALAISQKAHGPEHRYTARSLDGLASALQGMGEDAAARPLYERALAIYERTLGPEHPLTATGLGNLAQMLVTMGESTAARSLYERALAISQKVYGSEHPNTAMQLYGLAYLLHDNGEYAAARPLYERALAIHERVLDSQHPMMALNLTHLARLQAAQGEIAGALEQALEAERIGREHLEVTGRSLSEREALRYAAVRQSGLSLALTLAAGGLEPTQRRRVLDTLVRSRTVVLDAMAARHRVIGRSADPGIARLAEKLTSRRARLANLVVRGPANLKPETHRTLLQNARKEKEETERELAGASKEFARDLSRGRLGLDDVAKNLPEGSTLIAFSSYERTLLTHAVASTVQGKPVASYLAFVLRAGSQNPEVVDLGPAVGIDAEVSRWKQEASRGALPVGDRTRPEAGYRAAGAMLRRTAWDPLGAAIGDAARLFVVPDGSLNLVNFAALPLDEGGYVIESGQIVHYLSAERDLVPSGETRRGAGLLALGGPNYDATEMFAALRTATKSDAPAMAASAATYRGQRAACGDFATVRFEPLLATARESREIVRLWEKHGDKGARSTPAAVLDLGEAAATESTLKRRAAGHRVLHLATHGFFLGGECESVLSGARGIGGLAEQLGTHPSPIHGENPLVLSGLALAGANHRSAAGEGEEDGILTAEEIASLDLSGVEWAVLSACETGVGDVRAGEGVFGLRRAFQVAGAGTLIMSLWSVDDQSTSEWMNALYQGRLEDHLDTAEAVRRASLSMLERRRKAGLSTHPFYWAAFVAAGDWR